MGRIIRKVNRDKTGRIVFLLLAAAVLLSCENSLAEYIRRQEDLATGIPRPVLTGLNSGYWITGHETLEFTFSEPIDATSFVLTGSLVGGGYDAVWDVQRQVVSVTPETGEFWPNSDIDDNPDTPGISLSLMMSGVADSGKIFADMDWQFNVFYGTCAGNFVDGGVGSVTDPDETIQGAVFHSIALYDGLVSLPEVRIQGGVFTDSCTYQEPPQSDGQTLLVEEPMLISGSWDAAFQAKGSGETILRDVSTTGSLTADEPSAPIVLQATGAINDPNYRIEDLTIELSEGTGVHAGIRSRAGYPEINRIKITGGSASSASYAYGVYSISAIDVVDCTIDPGKGGTTYGVYIDKRTTGSTVGPNVYGGTISSGDGATEAWGVAVLSDAVAFAMGMYVDVHDVTFTGKNTVPASGGGCVYSYDCGVGFDGNTFWQSNASLDGIYLTTNADPADEYWMARYITNNDFTYTGDWYTDPGIAVNDGNDDTQTVTVNKYSPDTRLLFNAVWGNTRP